MMRRPAGDPAASVHATAVAPSEVIQPHVMNAYTAAAYEVEMQAEALAAGVERLEACPVDIACLLDQVAAVLRPLAESGGVRLLRDGVSTGVHHQQADARRLHSVIFHLVARALAAETPGGHVRVAASWCAGEACVRILSRNLDPPTGAATTHGTHDLAASRYVLDAMGGVLLLEPRRGGYQPICVVLRTPPRAAALRVA